MGRLRNAARFRDIFDKKAAFWRPSKGDPVNRLLSIFGWIDPHVKGLRDLERDTL